MSKIITIAHQKGGVGKSTLALNLAYSFAKNVNTILTFFETNLSLNKYYKMSNLV